MQSNNHGPVMVFEAVIIESQILHPHFLKNELTYRSLDYEFSFAPLCS